MHHRCSGVEHIPQRDTIQTGKSIHMLRHPGDECEWWRLRCWVDHLNSLSRSEIPPTLVISDGSDLTLSVSVSTSRWTRTNRRCPLTPWLLSETIFATTVEGTSWPRTLATSPVNATAVDGRDYWDDSGGHLAPLTGRIQQHADPWRPWVRRLAHPCASQPVSC